MGDSPLVNISTLDGLLIFYFIKQAKRDLPGEDDQYKVSYYCAQGKDPKPGLN